MNTKDLILTIDNGTQSLRALIYDLNGQLKAKEKIVFTPYFSNHPGWAEQHVSVFWDALCTACQKLWHNQAIDKNRIAGVALTTQRGSVVPVDKEGQPLRPLISWLDQRKTYNISPISGIWQILFKILGVSDTVLYFQREAEANWIYHNQPEIWEKTHKFLLLSGYLTHKLIGEYVDSVACQIGFIPFDYKNLNWVADWDWRWKGLPITPDMLPKLMPPSSTLGYIHKQASIDTGIPEGLPLISAAADKACEVIGSGSLDPSIGCLSYGTTATINVTHSKYIEAIRFLPAYPSAVPNYYTMEIQIFRGFWMISWFKKLVGYSEDKDLTQSGQKLEELFDKLVEEIPPGSMGLMLQPYWSPGVRFPGPEAKGCILGFGDVHTNAHIYRAILEGLAYALREGKEKIEQRTKIPISQLRVSGGGSQSNSAMQVTADIFGLPTIRPHVYETSGLGAAIDAAVGLKFYDDFQSAVTKMTHIGDTFEPNLEHHDMYQALYHSVYKNIYNKLRPLYEKIRDITGYPQ